MLHLDPLVWDDSTCALSSFNLGFPLSISVAKSWTGTIPTSMDDFSLGFGSLELIPLFSCRIFVLSAEIFKSSGP